MGMLGRKPVSIDVDLQCSQCKTKMGLMIANSANIIEFCSDAMK